MTDIKLVDIHYNDRTGKVWKTFADHPELSKDWQPSVEFPGQLQDIHF